MSLKISKNRMLILFPILIVACMAFVFTVTSYSGNTNYEHPEGYIQNIDPASYEESSIDIPSIITKYELIIIDAAKFKQTADTGTMNLNLAGTSFVLEMEPGIWVNEDTKELFDDENGNTVEREMEPIYQYNGIIRDQTETSKVLFTMDNQTVLGTIDSTNERYVIEQIGWVMDNNTKRTVYVAYKESDLKSIISSYPSGKELPLEFSVYNSDEYPHTISVELFDSAGTLIFANTYALGPNEYVISPEMENTDDNYIYKATLEDNVTATYNFIPDAYDYSAASIDIINDSDNGKAFINFGMSIA
ncbi:hypothetical protein [Methanolobus vulcani]|uniref:Uncharacterized protein n=1 Tax=Methanolobus vulcani TaxID=38026 RepID=A0A7Z8P3B6_9EURY|nr:hypothetical protein [Methanolobus vulcani]TQD28423.1 hypothetical protein FKV42_01830 [Methanolobus vulcani]